MDLVSLTNLLFSNLGTIAIIIFIIGLIYIILKYDIYYKIKNLLSKNKEVKNNGS